MFVTFEGPEGAGKSTVIEMIAGQLRQQGYDVLTTREPGSGSVGAAIREVLLQSEDIDPKCELFLFLADRAQHITSVVEPALAASKLVLCDRHADSTLVYQGYGRGINIDQLRAWNSFATGGLKPALTLLLDLPAAVGLARLQSRDRLDREPEEFHVKIRNGFRAEAGKEPERWMIIDANRSVDLVAKDAFAAILKRLTA